MTVAFPSQLDNRKCFQTLPRVPCRAKNHSPASPVENHCYEVTMAANRQEGCRQRLDPKGGWLSKKKKKKPVTGQMFQAFWVLLCFVFVWNHIPGWVGEQGFSTVLDAHSPVPGLCPPGLCGTYLIRCLIKLLWSEFCLKCILGMHY